MRICQLPHKLWEAVGDPEHISALLREYGNGDDFTLGPQWSLPISQGSDMGQQSWAVICIRATLIPIDVFCFLIEISQSVGQRLEDRMKLEDYPLTVEMNRECVVKE
jgi:hypothetical protein